jgi:hypothetical protein
MPYGDLLNGLGLGSQLLGMSLAVLVLRKRKIEPVIKEKSKKNGSRPRCSPFCFSFLFKLSLGCFAPKAYLVNLSIKNNPK